MECEGFTLEGETTIKLFSSEESINDDIETYEKNGDVFWLYEDLHYMG